MTDRRYRNGLRIIRFGKDRPLFEQSLETGVVIGAKTQQIVIAKLIDNDRKQQLRLLPGFR